MPERSQPGNNYPHFSVHRLRQRAAQGLGEQGSDQAEVDRLFVTSPEGGRPDPHIIDADDVTRGLGLDHDLSLRISQVVRDTRADYSTKSAQQRIVAARGRLIAVMRAMVPHVPSDARQEVMRRAIAYWKTQAPIDLGRTPQMRFGVNKSEAGDLVKAKYRKRVATGNPKRPWRYIYDEGQSPAKAKESADVEKLTKLIGRIRPALAALRAKDTPTSAPFHALAGTITAGMTLADRLYKHLTGRSIPKKKVAPTPPAEDKPKSDKKRGEDKKPRKKAERKKVGMLARALLKAYRELAALLEEAHEGAKVAEAREATPKAHTQEALLAAGGKLWEAHGKWKVFQEEVAKWEKFKKEHSQIRKSMVAAIPLGKAMNAGWGTGPSGSGGPGSRTDSLPDFSIYLSPEYQGRRERELLAAENRRDAERDRARRMWGPREQEGGNPELRYERQGWEARYAERTKPMLGIRKPTARGAKIKGN